MRILILTDRYPPEIRSAAHLYHDLAREFRRRDHEVAIITKVPRDYVEGGATGALRPGWDEIDGVRILRVRGSPFPGRGPLARGLDHVFLGWAFSGAILPWDGVEGIIVYSPPLPLAVAGGKYRRRFGCPLILNVQDIYPQTAIDLGLLRNSAAIALAERVERRAYRLADGLVVHSDGNRDFLSREKGVPPAKVRTIYNWVDFENLRPGSRENVFSIEHGLGSKFVVSYAGLMGYAQDLMSVLACAELLLAQRDILFLLVGEGVLEEKWKKMTADKGLGNVRFLPMQSRERYGQLLAASDVCLVPLDEKLRTPVVPGKLQSIMASSRPAITIVGPKSDARKLVAESGGGMNVSPGEPRALADAVLLLRKDASLKEKMGLLGRRFAEEKFSLGACVDAYEALLSDLRKEER